MIAASLRRQTIRNDPFLAGRNGARLAEVTRMANPAWSSILLGGALALALAACDSDPERPGSPGAHPWLPGSVALKISTTWSFDGPNGAYPTSGGKSASWTRSELSADQEKWLEALVLLPLNPQCSVDGYSFVDLEVRDDSGADQLYRSTGCDLLKIAGATAQLPDDAPPESFWR
jgi:hypothetical protein